MKNINGISGIVVGIAGIALWSYVNVGWLYYSVKEAFCGDRGRGRDREKECDDDVK